MTEPDQWLVLRFDNGNEDEVFYKVYASFFGGYTDGDSWKLNSGIASVEEDEKSFTFVGQSGSKYKCVKGAYNGGTMYTSNILTAIIEHGNKSNVKITIMPPDTDWVGLFNDGNN